jgi:hypothetical protein
MMIFILLPVIFFLSISVMFFHTRSVFTYHCWRSSCLVSSTLFVLIVALSTEILSLLHLLNRSVLVFFWGVITVVSVCVLWLHFKEQIGAYRLTVRIKRDFNIFSIGSVSCIAAILAIIAVVAPPNTWDSMSYHLSRVMHWMQNQSIAHYPTAIIRQLYVNPFAEYVIMHIYMLTGSDRFVNLVQWSSMIGSCIGVSLIARRLGASLCLQIIASLFCVTIPMGILQATSTQTDYINSFMLVSLVYYLLEFKASPKLFTVVLIGISLGEAILTKAIAYFYAFPFMLWSGILLLMSRIPAKRKFLFALLSVLLFFTLNSGHYIRNYKLFKSPIGVHKEYNNEGIANEVFTLKSLTSNVIRNIAFHIQVPSHKIRALEKVQQIEEKAIKKIHNILQFDINDPRTTYPEYQFHLRPMSTHEDLAGNLAHFILIVFCMMLMGINYRNFDQLSLIVYLCCLIFGFLLFCLYIPWSPTIVRYHLPLFVLAAPFTSVVMGKTLPHRLIKLIAVLLVLQSTLWVFHNYTRPIIAKHNIFNTSRIEQYFINRPDLMESYVTTSQEIVKNDPEKIGLIIRGDDWEYPFWILTDALNKGIQIHHTQVKNISSTLEKADKQYDLILTVNNTQNIIKIAYPSP